MTPAERLSEFLSHRWDEIAYAKHGLRAGARLQQTLEAVNRGEIDAMIAMKEDLSLPEKRVILVSHNRQDLEIFDL